MELGLTFVNKNSGCFMSKAISILFFSLLSLSIDSVAASSKHVVIISMDGGGPSFLKNSAMPVLTGLIANSAQTMNARTVNPNVTLPSHTSMLTGVGPEIHGITWNSWIPSKGTVKVPTIFGQAKSMGLKTALFAGKDKFNHLNVKGSLDVFSVIDGSGAAVVKAATQYLVAEKPNLLFVHLPDGDTTGHTYGWGSAEQKKAFADVDKYIASIISAIKKAGLADDTTVIITADHGGEGRMHNASKPINWTIPWIAIGPRVQTGALIKMKVQTLDTAATALWLLGGNTASMQGKPVTEAFY